jgi:hypothetical protein
MTFVFAGAKIKLSLTTLEINPITKERFGKFGE